MTNKAMPLVSIAMATYNGEKYLSKQIDSLVNQSYKNIEIVVVDDCSSDDTINILETYEKNFPFIHIHKQPSNNGVTKTFNNAINLCKGKYIATCDQDDIWELNKIEILVYAIEEGKENAVFSNSCLIDANGNRLDRMFSDIMSLQSYYCGAPFLLSNSIPGHTILMKTDFVKAILPIPNNLLFDLWIGFNAASNNGIKYVDKALVYYRQHATNAIGTAQSTNAKKKKTAAQEFEEKKRELQTLSKANIRDTKTKIIVTEMLLHFHRGLSIKRSIFFFKYFDELLVSKKKPYFRKVLYCIKMIFKPNF